MEWVDSSLSLISGADTRPNVRYRDEPPAVRGQERSYAWITKSSRSAELSTGCRLSCAREAHDPLIGGSRPRFTLCGSRGMRGNGVAPRITDVHDLNASL